MGKKPVVLDHVINIMVSSGPKRLGCPVFRMFGWNLDPQALAAALKGFFEPSSSRLT